MKTPVYASFLAEAQNLIPANRIFTDELKRLAWGTDAGFYRLIPQIVIQSANEHEVSCLLQAARKYQLPVTFRAAGTSLSGQAISDSILIVAGQNWKKYSIHPDGTRITLEPGIIGQRVNELLAPYGRKFAPDPASIKSAMVGGIIMNNASGMNCGTHANSDKVLLSVRMVLADGTILDTGNEASRQQFQTSHPDFLRKIAQLRDKVRNNEKLAARIKYKYSIKNVTGLNLLPLVTFDDPFDIISHALVGSEGTLAFLSQATMQTEHDYPCKASAMLYFTTIRRACEAVVMMRPLRDKKGGTLVKSAEMLDYKSLSSVNDPIFLRFKAESADPSGLTAVLTEVKGDTPEELHENIRQLTEQLKPFETYTPVSFTDVPEEYAKYWAIRSGIFPSVGGTRKLGTTCLIEDIAFHIEDLPNATEDLQKLIARHGYDDACIYGHALEGNYHFIINQSFSSEQEVQRYEKLMEEVKELVVDKYDGSLKAEHGTGRNMAPFVRHEWGDDAFEAMKELKAIFDPDNLLNPGVIFNNDPKCHIKHFKALPIIPVEDGHPATKVNRCIECGFCEVNCLTCGYTLSSRQRIVLRREIAHLEAHGTDNNRLAVLRKAYRYSGEETCAGDGLCAMSCPMGINTGDLTHWVRQQQLPHDSTGYKIGNYAAQHFSAVKSALRPILTLANWGHHLIGTDAMDAIGQGMHKRLGLPRWNAAMPGPYHVNRKKIAASMKPSTLKVVYFPSCINQTMGLPKNTSEKKPLVNEMVSLLQKAGYEIIFPPQMDKLCCGTIWESKGMMDIADAKVKELEQALWKASEQGKYPILCDQSPCLHRMREQIKSMKLYEPVEFISTYLADRLDFHPQQAPIAIHITCSMRKMGLDKVFLSLAKRCASQVLIPEEVSCCGFAGDKGFTHPEVNKHALRNLRPQLEAKGIRKGYSNSRTCEIGLTTNSGIPYVSIVYLVDQCTTAKVTKKEAALVE